MDEPTSSSVPPSQDPLSNASSPTSRFPYINETIPARIRSLLASRHERHPPRVPLPTPDPSFSSRLPEENTHDYFSLIGDLAKRLSVLESPERRYRLINPNFDGTEDGTVTPGFLTKEHSWRQQKPVLDPRKLVKGPKSYQGLRRAGSDGSDDLVESGLHGQQRA